MLPQKGTILDTKPVWCYINYKINDCDKTLQIATNYKVKLKQISYKQPLWS